MSQLLVALVKELPPSNSQLEHLRRARNNAVGYYSLPMQEREVRSLARAGSLVAASLLSINAITFHSVHNLSWAATVLFVVVALGNLAAAFSENLSIRCFLASITDLGLALGSGMAFVLQAAALEMQSPAVSMGLNLVAVVLEILVIASNLGLSLCGAAADEALERKGGRCRIPQVELTPETETVTHSTPTTVGRKSRRL